MGPGRYMFVGDIPCRTSGRHGFAVRIVPGNPDMATPFEPGMIVSDEPGYYKAGEYGIRIENLVMVVESAVGDGKFLEFETLTLAPIDTRPIEISLLSAEERDWLNAYHARVLKEIGPLVKGGVLSWLRQATRPR